MVIAHLARMHPRIDHPSLLPKPWHGKRTGSVAVLVPVVPPLAEDFGSEPQGGSLGGPCLLPWDSSLPADSGFQTDGRHQQVFQYLFTFICSNGHTSVPLSNNLTE